ncbi:ethanolamine utilization protein EutJ [Clostridium thailandense]|uniref:Ethanolamine utilization protein EutJ n=1 Tax=Clostridium thailandense TaxID=2794346 RepID=A0A949TZL2_9CLOT|nr:ethanolamine utilization protein EutJ [Clostridium thailandense]MBV7273494.1 ethanolamine utilization protein EutJ [Clostridium thailandense]
MLENANKVIKEMEDKILDESLAFKNSKAIIEKLTKNDIKVGVDLGTSNIVVTVLDKENKPIACALKSAGVVKDGIVVDYIGAVNIARELKERLEKKLNLELNHAATAIPPGIIKGNVKVIKNVVEASGFQVTNVIDEPEAAARVLNTKNGAVVDVGGGTTGISVLQDGKVIFSADEPTGGTHLTLVTAGNFNIPFENAEKYKLDPSNYNMVFPLVTPVIEKMADIVLRSINGFNIDCIYLVGGTCCLKGIENVFQKYTSIKAIKPYNPLLVTPIGIAMSDT